LEKTTMNPFPTSREHVRRWFPLTVVPVSGSELLLHGIAVGGDGRGISVVGGEASGRREAGGGGGKLVA
jgi:hypothetical protein